MSLVTTYRIAALLMLIAMASEGYFTTYRGPEVSRYHERIRTAGEAVPRQVAAWVGDDVALQAQAVSVLRPNVMVSRRYVNVEDGTVAGLLLVHCADAHHMVGHFPLRCYPAQGWTVRTRTEKNWRAGGIDFRGTEYEFTRSEALPDGGPAVERSIVVVNCLLRPNGAVLRDMESMSKTIVGASGQASGAGQIQIYFDATVPKDKRDAAVVSLTEACLPTVRAILDALPS